MNKKFLTRVVLATALVGGVNFLPMPNFDVDNVQISVAYAESKNFAAKEAAMTDVEYIEAQAKEASRMRAIEAVKEKIASYVRNFSGVKGKLSEDDIAAIAEKFEEVGTARYKKLFYNAVDEDGKELGKVGIMYEATVTAKFNTKKITEYIKLTEQEKERRIRQAREAREKFEELDREYEELRKNARTKTPEQLKSEIKNFDDKLSDLEKRKGKNKPVKKDKPTTQQDKIQPMRFSNPVEIGGFGWGNLNNGGAVIKDASYVSETPIKHGKDVARWEYSKGVARFGEGKESVYVHYAKGTDFKIGSEAVNSTILYNHMWTTIFKVSAKNGYTMYFLKQHLDSPAPAYHYILIGQRPDGKWVKYFNTEDLSKQYLGNSKNVSIQKVTSNGDTIIVGYARCNRLPKEMGGYFYEKFADEFGEFRFKWDEAAKWFGVEKITYNQTPIEQKPVQENKPVTTQPMKFSQPVQIGRIYFPLGNTNMDITIENATYKGSKSDGTFQGDAGYSYDRLTKFGNNENDIYIHHKYRYYWELHPKANFGDRNIKNTVELEVSLALNIFQLKSNSSIKFYIVRVGEGGNNIILIGKKDGKWIKYFDTRTILKQYFGENFWHDSMAGMAVGQKSEVKFGNRFKHGLYCENDTIIIEYEKNNGGKGPIFGKDTNEYGEFRLKWDEKAQWFSIEQIKY